VSQQSTEQQPQGGEGVQQQAAAPPWGSDEEFNPERAWKKIQALEADKERLKNRPTLDADAKRKLAEYDALVESQKTEAQKQAEETARWQSEAERWRTTSVASTIKALAATDFEYPDLLSEREYLAAKWRPATVAPPFPARTRRRARPERQPPLTLPSSSLRSSARASGRVSTNPTATRTVRSSAVA
jgi:hypothetical protein